jgi:hypothetical protein
MSTPAMIAGMSSGNAIASQIQTNQAVKKMENEYAEWLDKDTKRRQRKREQEIEAEFELAHLIQQLSMEDDDGERTSASSNVPLSNHSNLHANTASVSTTTTTSSLVQNSHQQHQYAVGIQLLPSEQTLMDQLYRSRLDTASSSSPRSDSTNLFLTQDPTAHSHFALEVAPEFNQVITTVFKSIALDILRGEHPPTNQSQQQPQPQYSGRFVSLTKALDGLRRTTEEFQIKCNQLIGLLQQHP